MCEQERERLCVNSMRDSVCVSEVSERERLFLKNMRERVCEKERKVVY